MAKKIERLIDQWLKSDCKWTSKKGSKRQSKETIVEEFRHKNQNCRGGVEIRKKTDTLAESNRAGVYKIKLTAKCSDCQATENFSRLDVNFFG